MKIIVTGDIHRPVIGQHKNAHHLYYTVREALSQCGCPPRLFFHYDILPLNHWLPLLEHRPSILPSVLEVADLVIGFELPNGWISAFEVMDIPYIHFIQYPIRYMGTIYGMRIGIYTSSSRFIPVKYYGIDDSDIKTAADLMRASHSYKDNVLQPGTALIAGQTPVDRSLVDRHGLLHQLNNYEQEIKDVVQSHKQTLFKHHPNDWKAAEHDEYMKSLGCELYQDVVFSEMYSIYDILCEDNLRTVCTIGSSLGFEAKYFEKPVIRWNEDYYEFLMDYHPIPIDILHNKNFWGNFVDNLKK